MVVTIIILSLFSIFAIFKIVKSRNIINNIEQKYDELWQHNGHLENHIKEITKQATMMRNHANLLSEMVKADDGYVTSTVKYSTDDLLDRISKVGLNGINQDELEFLKNQGNI